MLTPISFRIPKVLRDRFDRVCNAESINKSKLIRTWIENFIEHKERELKIMVDVMEIIKQRVDFPVLDESYTVGRVEDGRYFFAWGPDYPSENDEGVEVVPSYPIDAGESGISFHENASSALSEMEKAISAVQSTRE